MSRRNGTTRTSRAAQAAAEAAATAAETAAVEEAAPTRPATPTIADRFVGIADLVVAIRNRTRLSEQTLAKLFEVALQYHAWQAQQDLQQEYAAGQQALARMANGEANADGDESLVGPEPNEIIRAVEDSGPVISGGIGEVINPDDPRHPNYKPELTLVPQES